MNRENSHLSLFLTFLRFGCLAWGGPVAQIAMIRDELVERRKWIDPEKFRRVLAVYQALPGPEAHELCVYFGMIRKGRWGGFLAGLGFMLPGFLLILLLAWAYTLFGATVLLPLFAGVTPAVTALIARALQRIGTHTLKGSSLWLAALVSVALTLLGVHFFWIFIICAIWQALWAKGSQRLAIACLVLMTGSVLGLAFLMPDGETAQVAGGGNLFAVGLKAGLLSFGGAYTAIPFLKDSMIGAYDGMTLQSFMDGIALSSIIPAPLVIIGTYCGYLADGLAGALLVTLGIFVPAFSFTLVGHGYLEKIIENPALHGFLDGVASAVVGLLAITTLEIAATTLTGVYQGVIFAVALAGLYRLRGKWSVPLVIIGCGVIGLVLPL